jgi:hypothetical protein
LPVFYKDVSGSPAFKSIGDSSCATAKEINSIDDDQLTRYLYSQVLDAFPHFQSALGGSTTAYTEKFASSPDDEDEYDEGLLYDEEVGNFFVHLNAQLDDEEAQRLGFESAYRLAGVQKKNIHRLAPETEEEYLSAQMIVFDEKGNPIYVDSEGQPVEGIQIPLANDEAFFSNISCHKSLLSDESDYSCHSESSYCSDSSESSDSSNYTDDS